jgi:chaperone required for assembly of F1-ATPase
LKCWALTQTVMTKMTEETADQRMQRLATDRYERPLPKRFYKDVSVSHDLHILLDGRTVKTPLKSALRLPNPELAEAVAAEWRAQEKLINPARMPLTKLANTVIDRASAERNNIIKELTDYANADLVCYRATEPERLVDLQHQQWDPILAWIKAKLNVTFTTTKGITHRPQSSEALATFAAYLAELDPWQLTAHYDLSTLTGSALLSTLIIESGISPDDAWTAVHVDEDFQIETWGQDNEALARRKLRRQEFDATVKFATLARDKRVYAPQGMIR